ncbi:MAG: hypothetical protein ABL952_00745 [Pyrinomonadaceae bacterium]
MKINKTGLSAILLLVISAVFMAGCGAPAANNGAGNQNAANAAANSNAAANTGATKAAAAVCTPADDTLIETQIRILIDASPPLFAQRRYINFDSKYCVVKLQGRLNTFDDFKNLYDRVSNVDGVRKVDISGITRVTPMPSPTPGAGAEECVGETKKCGELCIPKADDCNIPVETVDKTPTPKP